MKIAGIKIGAGWLLGGAAGALYLATRPRPPRLQVIGEAKLQPKRVSLDLDEAKPPAGAVLDEGTRTIDEKDEWSCKRAKDQPVPNVEDWIPPQALAASGPIGVAIVGGVGIVRQVFEAVGAKKVCTVVGGEYHQITTVPRSGAPRFWVQVVASFGPISPDTEGGSWIFRDNRSDTGPLSLRVETGGDTGGPKRDYLFHGGEPPGMLWPHVNIAKWRSWVPEDLDAPRADVVRSGNDLSLGVWLPPRAPDSHVNAIGQRKVDASVRWTITWKILAP